MTRCDLSTHHECSCGPSGVPCKVQSPIDLGEFVGTNHPDALEIIGQANNDAAKFGPAFLVSLSIIVFALVFCSGLTVGPINV